jgi:hypothetical protein
MRVEITYAKGSSEWKQTVRELLVGLDGLRRPYEIDLMESTELEARPVVSQPARPSMVGLDRFDLEPRLARLRHFA